MRRLWLLVPALLCVATTTATVAQSRGNIWHFGSGCATKGANLPHLALVGMPVVGRGFRLEIRTGQPRARCLLFLGGSNTTWQGQKLPLDLGPNGFAGCQLLVSPDFTVAFLTDAPHRMDDLRRVRDYRLRYGVQPDS